MSEGSRRVVVTGVGLISPFGDTPAALHEALCQQLSALRVVEQFDTDGLDCRHAAELREFSPKTYLSGNLRPLDRLSRIVASAAHLALESSGWTEELRERHEVGLVLGTMFSSVQVIATFDRRGQSDGPRYAKPMEFANSVLNAAAGQTAIRHGLRGINTTVSCGAASGVASLAYAANLIRAGRARAVLAGGAEVLSQESFVGFHQAGKLCRSEGELPVLPVPFDARRNGMALGEGAALLMLEELQAATERGANVIAELTGYGNSFDSSRGRDEGRATAAAARSIRLALESARITPPEIDCVSASAHGSLLLDRREARGLAAALGSRAATVPVTAIKSMLGETLGAGGAFQTVALLETLRTGALPGVRGLDGADDDFPLPAVARTTADLPAPSCGVVHSMRLDGGASSLVVQRHGAG